MSVLFDRMSEYSALTEKHMKKLTDSFYTKEEFYVLSLVCNEMNFDVNAAENILNIILKDIQI